MNGSTPEILTSSPADVARAAELLAQGALVAFATETVYGLGADARQPHSVAAIYAAKGRPAHNPLILHVPDIATAQLYCQWSDRAETLARAYWPGALTLVLPLRDGHGLSDLMTAGLDSVALRVPAHPTALRLLRAFGGPVAAPSANPSGRISPTTAAHVVAGLGSRVAAILDDGPCRVGLESTIVGLTGSAMLLRPGGLPAESIEATLGQPLQTPTKGTITAPGQMTSHYAPKAAVRLNAACAQQGEVLLGFGDMACDLNLSGSGDLAEAAAHLFEYLHRLDATGKAIAVAPVPAEGLGAAINDRLTRAAAPH